MADLVTGEVGIGDDVTGEVGDRYCDDVTGEK